MFLKYSYTVITLQENKNCNIPRIKAIVLQGKSLNILRLKSSNMKTEWCISEQQSSGASAPGYD